MKTRALISFLFLTACGQPPSTADGGSDAGLVATGGGNGGTGGGTGGGANTVTSTGTIGAIPANLRIGYGRKADVVALSDGGVVPELLLIFSDLPSLTCPTQSTYHRRSNEASIDVLIRTSGALVGTFNFATGTPHDTALGFALRAPANCPISVDDGTPIIGGSITIQSVTGSVNGMLTAQLQGGEQVTASFQLPLCNIAGIAATCQP